MTKYFTRDQIIHRFKIKHGNKFDYSKFIWDKYQSSIYSIIIVVCKKHNNEVETEMRNHERASYGGCDLCLRESKKVEIKNGKKQCTKCKIWKKLNEFSDETRFLSGKSSSCIDCERIRGWEKKKRLGSKNIESYISMNMYSFKRNAKNSNVRFNLEKDYLINLFRAQKGKCSISKVKLTHLIGKGIQINNVSLDRIIPKKGYVKGNVRWVCFIINTMRQDMDDNTFKKFCKNILKYA